MCDYDALKKALRDVEVVLRQSAGLGMGQYQIKRYADSNIGDTANLLDIIVNQKMRIGKIVVAASMSSYREGNICAQPAET